MARAIWTFEVYLDDADEPVVVEATSRDVAWWEKTSGKTLKYLYEHMPLRELVKVAHRSMSRRGLFEGTADDFAERVDLNIRRQQPGQHDEPDPTRADQSPEN